MNSKYKSVLTLKERIQIEALLKKDLTLSDISRELSRGRNTVIAEVRRNGGREKYKAAKAQQRYEDKMEKVNEIRRAQRKKQSKENLINTAELKRKVDLLEMQLEILTDELNKQRKLNDKENEGL